MIVLTKKTTFLLQKWIKITVILELVNFYYLDNKRIYKVMVKLYNYLISSGNKEYKCPANVMYYNFFCINLRII